jgi:invasion protein IalB
MASYSGFVSGSTFADEIVHSGTFNTKQDALRAILRTLVESGVMFPFTLHMEYDDEKHERQAKKFYTLYRQYVDQELTSCDVQSLIYKYTDPKDNVEFAVYEHASFCEAQEFKVKSYEEYVATMDEEEDTETFSWYNRVRNNACNFFKSPSILDSSDLGSLHYSGFVYASNCTDEIVYSGTFKTEQDASRGILRTLVESGVMFPFTLHMEYDGKKHEQQANEFYALYRHYVEKELTPFDVKSLIAKYTTQKTNVVFTVFRHEPFCEAREFKVKSYEEYKDSMDEEEESFFKSISEY